MAVSFTSGHSAASHASASSSSNQASFTWNVNTTSDRCVVVFVFSITGSTTSTSDQSTSVTVGGTTCNKVEYTGFDNDTECGGVAAYWIDNVTQGASTAVVVNRNNNAVLMWAVAFSFAAAKACEVYHPGIITQGGSSQNTASSTAGTGTGASGEVSVDDGTPGSNSMRCAGCYTGAASPIGAGTNSTTGHTNDLGAFGASAHRETNAGQGSRSVGFATGTTDDRGAIYLAVRESPATTTAFLPPGGAWVMG